MSVTCAPECQSSAQPGSSSTLMHTTAGPALAARQAQCLNVPALECMLGSRSRNCKGRSTPMSPTSEPECQSSAQPGSSSTLMHTTAGPALEAREGCAHAVHEPEVHVSWSLSKRHATSQLATQQIVGFQPGRACLWGFVGHKTVGTQKPRTVAICASEPGCTSSHAPSGRPHGGFGWLQVHTPATQHATHHV